MLFTNIMQASAFEPEYLKKKQEQDHINQERKKAAELC
jgi:hypothetical protein